MLGRRGLGHQRSEGGVALEDVVADQGDEVAVGLVRGLPRHVLPIREGSVHGEDPAQVRVLVRRHPVDGGKEPEEEAIGMLGRGDLLASEDVENVSDAVEHGAEPKAEAREKQGREGSKELVGRCVPWLSGGQRPFLSCVSSSIGSDVMCENVL